MLDVKSNLDDVLLMAVSLVRSIHCNVGLAIENNISGQILS